MKLQFTVQEYQTEAVDAVVDVFAGQPRHDGVRYLMDPGHRPGELPLDPTAAFRNPEIALDEAQLLANVRGVQRSRHLPASDTVAGSPAAPDAPNLDIEMETGTGKTYVYIKTIMEMYQRYGWSKFIIVVPSVAIREGVKKSFDVTADHFQETYGTKPRSFIYRSSQLHELEGFSSDAGVQVMIINVQAFNATGKDQRRIYDVLDDFQSRKPIDVIAANRPILIIDEPQKIDGTVKKPSKSVKALAQFNPLMVLRYSATHRVPHTLVHRLDALDAYQEKLVKKIAVRGITVRGLAGTTAYLYLDSILVKKGALPAARLELEVQTKAGPIKRQLKTVTKGTRLHELSNGIEAYRGLYIEDIRATDDTVHLSNGDVVMAGQLTDNDVTEDTKRRIQIREVIRAHLAKERELFGQGIKVLSLFFIDSVAKYRDYAQDDTLGEYARVFEDEYQAAVGEILAELDFDTDYRQYLQRDEVRQVHDGYFSIDKKGRAIDGTIAKTGEQAGLSADTDAYDLILKNKERLLSLAEPVRFIFSHSALREGWDNPNVFTMGMLKKSDNTISRRQEVGRGLRLSVNQRGERIDKAAVGAQVHDINELTVVTDESYTQFVTGLQTEIADALSNRPRQATAEFFTGKLVTVPETGEQIEVTEDQAKQLQYWLTQNGYIDYENHLTDTWTERSIDTEIPDMPAGLQPYFHQVAEIIDSLVTDVSVIGTDGRRQKKIPLNEKNFQRKEFQELWGRINHKAVYQVDFDSPELIRKCIHALNTQLRVDALQYTVQAGAQRSEIDAEDVAGGTGFDAGRSETVTERDSLHSRVSYDLLGEITEKTQLTRRTASAILRGIDPGVFAAYRQNPEQFITEAARLIVEEKAAVIVEHLTYDTVADRFQTAIFTENQTKVDFSKAGEKLTRHVYDYVITDSKVERAFVEKLDNADEVAVYAKLPRGFAIPTPVGDYNPDWAIAFKEGSVKHIYFVAETKGSLSSLQLRATEEIKIDCARKFFAHLAEQPAADVTYDVVHYDKVTDYAHLMQLVAQ